MNKIEYAQVPSWEECGGTGCSDGDSTVSATGSGGLSYGGFPFGGFGSRSVLRAMQNTSLRGASPATGRVFGGIEDYRTDDALIELYESDEMMLAQESLAWPRNAMDGYFAEVGKSSPPQPEYFPWKRTGLNVEYEPTRAYSSFMRSTTFSHRRENEREHSAAESYEEYIREDPKTPGGLTSQSTTGVTSQSTAEDGNTQAQLNAAQNLPISAVPEPEQLALIVAGLLGIIVYFHRRSLRGQS